MPATPHLVVDLDLLDANIARMAARSRDLDVALRPHVKTHKVPEIAVRQRDAGARGITVATVGEAEVFIDAGFTDVLIAYPVWLDADRGRRLAALTERASLTIGCDSVESARQAARVLAGAPVHVLIEVDSGQHRSGVVPEQAGALAAGVREAGLDVDGLFTFPGHSYGTDAEVRAGAARSEADALRVGAESLRAAGLEPQVRSGGSSPSMAFAAPGGSATSATEMRPGAYVFNDAQQWELGACTAGQIALTAHATVVSRNAAAGRIILDCGSKALAPDRPAWASGCGRLLDHPDARIRQLSEHHAVVEMNGPQVPQLGSIVRAVPNHCCNAVNYADALRVVQQGRTVATWPVAARGRND